MEWDVVIGLEVHTQLNTETKAFCSCKVTYGDAPNTHVCPVCLGYPGSLPVLNRELVNAAIMLGLSTDCRIRHFSTFARKNYFYPDLPKGYQISQYDDPICYDGVLDIVTSKGPKKIGITRIHMEEDAGKSIHGENGTAVDLNRCGTPLLEIVSEPDMTSPEEAYEYLTTIKQIVRYTGISDCNMEEGSMRCDANISLKPKGRKEFGTKTELKNMNSFHNVQKALEYEIERQRIVLEAGGIITQDTLLWDEQAGKTKTMRTKENSNDYRYFPEPDLTPVRLDDEWIERIAKTLPELPKARLNRFMSEFGLNKNDAEQLTSEKEIADYFEAVLKHFNQVKLAGNWVRNEILRILLASGKKIQNSPVSPVALAGLLKHLAAKDVTAQTAKAILDDMAETGKSASEIIKEKGLTQISDSAELETVVNTVIEENPAQLERIQNGEMKLLGFFIGQVMKKTQGKADQKAVRDIIMKKIK